MIFSILDVGHGSCSYLMADNSNLMLFDCGHKSDPDFRPSTLLRGMGQASVEYLFISNFDEDHISDLPNVRQHLNVRMLVRNGSIDAGALRTLKYQQAGELSQAMNAMVDMIGTYNGPPLNPPPEFPDVSYQCFHNNHPFGQGGDTNNISLVTFLTVKEITILLPGDIERAGWLQLLENPEFAARLRHVNIFVASHHGRENGYCAELFTEHACRPNVFVFSDSDIRHATQETTNTYASWAKGIQFNNQTRSVLTTRSDGTISWQW